MERQEDSTESGYDGGSQENILGEPHYESIRNLNGKSEESQDELYDGNGKEVEEGGKIEMKKKNSIPNGSAKFCNGYDKTEEKLSDLDCGKVTIHAVIEAMHADHMPEPQIDKDSIDSEDSYVKSDESIYPKSEATNAKEDDHYSKEELYAKLEEVYSRPEEPNNNVREKLSKPEKSPSFENMTTGKEDNNINETKKDEIKDEKTIVQKLVKVAEEEGVTPKPPTPPPRSIVTQGSANSEQTFFEEEYSYEPELKKSSSKLVLRTRSLLSLEEEKPKIENNVVRPPAVRMKITTGPDGTFVIDGKKANSELNLSDESNNGSPPKTRRSISGEELKKRKEEIFRTKSLSVSNGDKYNEEINKNGCAATKEEAIQNLKMYLKENNIGLKELLTNNNVVIIDTYRDKKSMEDLSDYNHKTVRDCRVTGTTAKGEARESNTLPRANKGHQPSVQRHYFYKLVKSKPKLPDEELPDPDKVRSTRQMFQKPKTGTQPAIMLPLAAKLSNPRVEVRPTPEVRLIQSDRSPRRWTDSGSLSSGVSSDMSLLDAMSEKSYSSDEEEMGRAQEADQHPVSPEVMKKIRACGTTITYYGGRVISHSHGTGNQMTATIMDEIRQGRQCGRGKFRLVKSNSCGSRLELAGTDEQQYYHELSHGRFYEDMYGGKPLSEEMRGGLGPVQEERKELEEFQPKEVDVKEEINHYNNNINNKKGAEDLDKDNKPSWQELIASRKQRRAMEHARRPISDMVFEEYQVLET